MNLFQIFGFYFVSIFGILSHNVAVEVNDQVVFHCIKKISPRSASRYTVTHLTI